MTDTPEPMDGLKLAEFAADCHDENGGQALNIVCGAGLIYPMVIALPRMSDKACLALVMCRNMQHVKELQAMQTAQEIFTHASRNGLGVAVFMGAPGHVVRTLDGCINMIKERFPDA